MRMPAIIEGEAIIIDDGSSDQHSILPSWLEPLPEGYKARRAWIALGTGILISIFFAYLSWKLYLLHQLLSARGALTLLGVIAPPVIVIRSEEHTSELQSLMRISYAVFCLKKKKNTI